MGLVHLHICQWHKNNGDCFYQKVCWQKALWNRYTTTFSGFGQIFSNSRFDKDCVIDIFVFAKGTSCVLNAKPYTCLCPRSLYWWVFSFRERWPLSWLWATATVHPFPHSSVGRKLEQRVYACVFDTVAALCVRAVRTSGLIHIILNRIFPSRVLLPPSFRSLPQDSRFSRKSAASPRAHCLFWSIIVPEVQKQWVSTAATPPTCHELLNY